MSVRRLERAWERARRAGLVPAEVWHARARLRRASTALAWGSVLLAGVGWYLTSSPLAALAVAIAQLVAAPFVAAAAFGEDGGRACLHQTTVIAGVGGLVVVVLAGIFGTGWPGAIADPLFWLGGMVGLMVAAGFAGHHAEGMLFARVGQEVPPEGGAPGREVVGEAGEALGDVLAP